MFNINPAEMLIIAVIFLLVFGPERLPEMAVQLGRWYRDIRDAIDQAGGDFTRELEAAALQTQRDEAAEKSKQRAARPAAPEADDAPEPGPAPEPGDAPEPPPAPDDEHSIGGDVPDEPDASDEPGKTAA